MQTKIPFILLIALIVLGGAWYLIVRNFLADDTVAQDPFAELPSDIETPNTDPTKRSLRGDNGARITVNNFLEHRDVSADATNEGVYYLGNTYDTTDAAYVVTYNVETDLFTIALLKEPLAESRLAVEAYLSQLLGIPNNELCNLKYIVSVPLYVSEYVSGYSLGFSTCPGSAQL